MYDEKKADRAVKFIELLKHTKGKWAGTRFKLEEWQESYDFADQALHIKLEKNVRERAKKKLKKALKIRDTAKEKRNLSAN